MNTLELTADTIATLERLAAIIAKSGMGGFRSPEQATVGLLLALGEGIPLGRMISEYHVINGRLSLRSECMLARFQKSGGKIQYITYTPEEVSVSASHTAGGSLSVTWTMERARRSGIARGEVWEKHPAAMLKARAVSEAVRAVYPACLSGLMIEEEAQEITTPPAHNGSNGSNGTHPVQLPPARECLDSVSVAPDTEPAPEPAPRDYVISELPQKQWTRRRKGERSPAFVIPQQDPAILTQEIDRRIAEVMAEPAPAPQCKDQDVTAPVTAPEVERHEVAAPVAAPEVETHEVCEVCEVWHELDDLLHVYEEEDVNAFMRSRGLIHPHETYRNSQPWVISRVRNQWDSFLRAGNFRPNPNLAAIA